MRVLITNGSLQHRSGTERYAVELAIALRNRGHEVMFYTPRLGMTAKELRNDGFMVSDDLDEIVPPPDVIHGQHTLASLRAACAFLEAPLMYICHDALSLADAPTPSWMTDAYAAVDRLTAQRIATEAGTKINAIHGLGNTVDVDRFQQRKSFARVPRKALIYSGSILNDGHFHLIRKVCAELKLELEEAGEKAEGFFDSPESQLNKYDIIFCKARCAMEAMASGAYVILIGDNGMGEKISSENIADLRTMNFGREALHLAHSEELLRQQIAGYDAKVAKEISDWVHQHLTPEVWIDEIEKVYQSLISKPTLRSELIMIPKPSSGEYRGWTLQINAQSQRLECVKVKGVRVWMQKIQREWKRVRSRLHRA